MSKLALLGGPREVDGSLAPYETIGEEEVAAATRVVRSGRLSGFVGAWCEEFRGGPEVRGLEEEWAERFRARHAVTVNSNTSGLVAAMGAVGVGPGDEVIVPPYSMSATAIAPLAYGGIPVFADIEPETFCLDPARVRAALTDRTRAILAVNLFGHPAPLQELRALADERGLALVEDNAQAPLASEHDRYAGTIGHIGVFSLNFHKHFHTGEGGVCTTDDEDLAERLRMIRNHGENVVSDLRPEDLSNLVGFNFRLSEVSAAIGREQLRKAERLVAGRVALAERLTRGIAGLPGITPPAVRAGCRHVYYVWAARFDERRVGVSRETFAHALAAEGVPVSQGYVEPLYLLPVFQRRIAIGRDGWPFSLTARTYPRGLCPAAERMHEKEVLEFFVCSYSPTETQLGAIVDAFHKVHEHRRDLAPLAVPCPS